MTTPVDIICGFYRDSALPWSAQDVVNWIPEIAQKKGTRTIWKLRGAPGMTLLADAPLNSGQPAGPIRGAIDVEGRYFFVPDNRLCERLANGTIVVRGTIPGTGPVSMAYNQHAGGYQLLVANGDSSGYVWNTADNTFKKITDDGYPGAITVDYLASYLIQVEPFGRYWFHSELADAFAYNTNDHYESEGSPDRIVGAFVCQLEVVVMNTTTTEFYYNTGRATNTFERRTTVMQVGCASRHTVRKIGGTLVWLDNFGRVVRLQGYDAVPISTDAVAKAIADCDWSRAIAYTFESEGHQVYYLTFPDGRTWGFDLVTGETHRRESFGLKRWRLNTLTKSNGQWIGGDFQRGRLYALGWKVYTENGAPLIAELTPSLLHNNQDGLIVNDAELIVGTGTARQGVTHEVMLRYSDDAGYNFKSWKIRSLGKIGQYMQRVVYQQLGQTLARVWQVRIASDGPRDLLGAVLNAEGTAR